MSEKTSHHYTESLSYELELTAKYCRAFGMKITAEICPELSLDEVIILDTLSCNPGICQRDLARFLLKDRANTGRVLEILEKKGYIKRYDDRKNNRLVRKVELSSEGSEILKSMSEKFETAHSMFAKFIPDEEALQIKERLRKIRDSISNVVELQI